MRLPRFRNVALVAGALGLVAPVLYYTWQSFREYVLGDGMYLWPTGIIQIITYGHEHDWFGYSIVALSIALNTVVYAAVAGVLWSILWLIRRLTAKKA
jgi:ABC-type spermidine/putrescine transport system permease subunit II